MIPESIQKFIEAFSKLPSIGPRLATRLAFHLAGLDRTTLHTLAVSLNNLKGLARCERCFFIKNEKEALCAFCSNSARNPRVIAIVEKDTDVLSIERTHTFQGQYLVLGDLPERGALETTHVTRLSTLKSRIAQELGGKADELIIAVNPTAFGDFVTQMIRQEFKGVANAITRLGRGIPTGGEIEFADEETLASAFERRL